MIVQYHEGDLIAFLTEYSKTDKPHIWTAHGCNCQAKMGSGYAPLIANAFEGLREADIAYRNLMIKHKEKAESMLGYFSHFRVNNVTILNMYTQLYPGKDLRLGALEKVFKVANNAIKFISDNSIIETTKDLHIPLIGCGIAGGDWDTVEQVIEATTPDINVHVWYLPGQDPRF